MTLVEKLVKQKDFTDTEIKIAEFIINNLENVPNMYIQKLAETTFSSHSAIIRLCQKLGFSGYRDFKIELIHEIQSSKHTPTNVDPNFPFLQTDNPIEIAKKMADLSIETIKKTYSRLDNQTLKTTVDIIQTSEKIFLFSNGDSQIRARGFQNKFIKVNKHLIIADEYGEASWNAVSISKKDCAIIVSYTGNSDSHTRILKYLSSNDIPTIVLTGNSESIMLEYCAVAIEVPRDEYDFFKIGTFSSQISLEYVLDILFSIIYAREYTKNLNNLSLKEGIFKKWEI